MKRSILIILLTTFLSCSQPPKIKMEDENPYVDYSGYPQDTVLVEILNGTGKDALGRFVADTLKSTKALWNETLYVFDVIRIDNWYEPELDRTFIVDRKDSMGRNARILCEATSVDPPLVEIRKNTMQDVTIIVGPDYEIYFGSMDSSDKIW
ncbi:LytR C-terminal domain-containing protein [candidate division WOR-3 bacterium]|nr:LytR C-terminal domain-containing protein [candidate division WOR-3 bacterium]